MMLSPRLNVGILPSEEGTPPSSPDSTLLLEVLFTGLEICLTQELRPHGNGDGPIFSDLGQGSKQVKQVIQGKQSIPEPGLVNFSGLSNKNHDQSRPSHRAHVQVNRAASSTTAPGGWPLVPYGEQPHVLQVEASDYSCQMLEFTTLE